jgi:hypothetical protein
LWQTIVNAHGIFKMLYYIRQNLVNKVIAKCFEVASRKPLVRQIQFFCITLDGQKCSVRCVTNTCTHIHQWRVLCRGVASVIASDFLANCIYIVVRDSELETRKLNDILAGHRTLVYQKVHSRNGDRLQNVGVASHCSGPGAPGIRASLAELQQAVTLALSVDQSMADALMVSQLLHCHGQFGGELPWLKA